MTITHGEVDIFVGSKIGSFKHIKYHTDHTLNSKKCVENLVDVKTLQKDDGITCMQWGNDDQTEILIGRKNQQIQIYSTTQQEVIASHTADFAPGHVVGLGRYNRKLIAATSSGVVRVWRKKEESMINTGGPLDVMTMCADDPTLFVTGGEENELKLWRIGSDVAEFTAKNLSHDWLQLRRAVWVAGAAFAPREGGRLLAACSRHGYVRLYDTRAQRRPVCNVDFPNMAATCIIPSFDERQFLVGFGRGQIHEVDLRNTRPGKGYAGCAGVARSLATAPAPRRVLSVSLDRHLRVHAHSTKELLYKQYLTSQLTCILVQTATSTPLRNFTAVVKEEEEKVEAVEVGDDLDDIFDRMETVGEKRTKSPVLVEPTAKRVKPSTEGCTDASAEFRNEAIAKLLRSTEKQKRKREKKKKEKRAKSIFYNA